MSEWKEYKLGDVVAFGNGKVRPTTIGEIPVYGGNGILDYCNTHNYLGENVIIGRVGAYCGSVYYENKPIWVSDNALAAKPKNGYNAKFLYYYLTNLRLNEFAEGSSHPLVTQTLLNSIDVRITNDIAEQERIAGILSSLDDKIDLLGRQNRTLEAMVETLFRQYFIENPKTDWKNGKIADIIDFNPIRKLSKDTIAPFLEMSNLSTTTYAPNGWYNRAFSSGTKFKNGDTLLARITPCLENGKTAYVNFLENEQVAWGSTEYIVMRSKGELHPFFAYIIAKYQDFRDYAESCMSGSSGRQRVDVDNLKGYEIKIPDPETIEQFNISIESIIGKMNCNNNQIRILTKLRDTLLPKLMNNEIKI